VQHSLRFRFPEALIAADQEGLVDVLGKVHKIIVQPGYDPKIPLDLRGTAYEVKVWRMLCEIPSGETTNYGALAAELGTRDAREVTAAISMNPIAILVPSQTSQSPASSRRRRNSVMASIGYALVHSTCFMSGI
jgi:AraC family transcriptional regulator of adaptative response/methylated-DNA-[protein]-cysteine methyltransferase